MSGGRIAATWPDGACSAWVALPVALLHHAPALGIDDGEFRLLAALEMFRRQGDEAVFPSQRTLAALCDCDVTTIERRVKALRKRGLIEVERRARPGGKRVNHYRRDGLGAELARLEGERCDPAPLRASGPSNPAPVRGSNPAPVRATNPASVRAEVEEGKTDAEKEHTAPAPDLPALILEAFDTEAGTSYDLRDWRSLLASRVAEQPQLDIEDHRKIIAAFFRGKRWWQPDPPSPQMLYERKQFEQARQVLTRRGRYTHDDEPASSRPPGRYTREGGPPNPSGAGSAAVETRDRRAAA
jgi:DNA-binding MarR family transcriptional regulator